MRHSIIPSTPPPLSLSGLHTIIARTKIKGTYNETYTDNAFTVNELRFTVPTDGLYHLAFAQGLPMGALGLRTISLTEVQPYDIKIKAQDVLPAKIPASQMEGISLETVTICSASGAVLLNQTVGATSFSCSTTGYTPGIYIVKATTKTGTKIQKVTIL